MGRHKNDLNETKWNLKKKSIHLVGLCLKHFNGDVVAVINAIGEPYKNIRTYLRQFQAKYGYIAGPEAIITKEVIDRFDVEYDINGVELFEAGKRCGLCNRDTAYLYKVRYDRRVSKSAYQNAIRLHRECGAV